MLANIFIKILIYSLIYLFDFSSLFLPYHGFLRWTFMGHRGRQMARLWHEVDSGSCWNCISLGKGCDLCCSKNVQVQDTSFSPPKWSNLTGTKSPKRRVRIIFCCATKFSRHIWKRSCKETSSEIWSIENFHRERFTF